MMAPLVSLGSRLADWPGAYERRHHHRRVGAARRRDGLVRPCAEPVMGLILTAAALRGRHRNLASASDLWIGGRDLACRGGAVRPSSSGARQPVVAMGRQRSPDSRRSGRGGAGRRQAPTLACSRACLQPAPTGLNKISSPACATPRVGDGTRGRKPAPSSALPSR